MRASTLRSSPSCGAPIPGGSTTRNVASVAWAESSARAIAARRSSGTGATPTFGFAPRLPYGVAAAPAWVRALKSVVLPAFGGPTIPISSGKLLRGAEADPGVAGEALQVHDAAEDDEVAPVVGLEVDRAVAAEP